MTYDDVPNIDAENYLSSGDYKKILGCYLLKNYSDEYDLRVKKFLLDNKVSEIYQKTISFIDKKIESEGDDFYISLRAVMEDFEKYRLENFRKSLEKLDLMENDLRVEFFDFLNSWEK